MAKATIKSRTGAIITIEGTQQEISAVLAHFENAVAVDQKRATLKKENVVKKEQKKRMTASDLMVTLKEEGYLDKPKSLTEIACALEEKGYIYPVTTLSGVMINLVQKKLFGRKKSGGKWVYGK